MCYPNVLLEGSSVHFVGVSDIVEPNEAWRGFKRELTGNAWDYVFRRLLFTWTTDITHQEFSEWLEIANREKTAGRIIPGDVWHAPDGLVHVVWEESAQDMRMRARFFPNERQRWELNYAVLREGKNRLTPYPGGG